MKKHILIIVILASFLVGFISGVLISNRYQTTTAHGGSTVIKTNRLTGKVVYSRYDVDRKTYGKYVEIPK